MKEGAEFRYTIKLGLLKFPWRTLITKYDPNKIFIDEQKFGPYKNGNIHIYLKILMEKQK